MGIVCQVADTSGRRPAKDIQQLSNLNPEHVVGHFGQQVVAVGAG